MRMESRAAKKHCSSQVILVYWKNAVLCPSMQEWLTLGCFAGNIGSELSYTDVGVFISSDGGNSWRQVCFAEWWKAWSLLLVLFWVFPVEWNTHVAPDLFADLRGGIQRLVSGLGRGTSGLETHISAHPAHVVRKLIIWGVFLVGIGWQLW